MCSFAARYPISYTVVCILCTRLPFVSSFESTHADALSAYVQFRHPESAMQEVSKNRALTKKVTTMEATIQQAGALKADVQRLERQVADLRIANTSLKANLHDSKHPSSAAGQSSAPVTSPDEAILRQKLAVQVRTSISNTY